MTVSALRDSMTGAEFQDWIRYYNAEPFGFVREEYRHALSVAAQYTASPHAFPAKRCDPSTYYFKRQRAMSEEEQEEMLYTMFNKPRPGSGGAKG